MGWTDISASRKDADSPIDEDLVSDLDDNATYNHDRAIRSGTHATGARTAMARGRETFSGSSINTISVAIDFTAAEDGIPNWSAEPVVVLTLEENTSGDNWLGVLATCYIEDASLTDTGCTVRINWGGTNDYWGWVHWVAIGTVTAGE